MVLMYWNEHLSPGQSKWHPFLQEFLGIYKGKREVVKQMGRIPCVIHTDHANIARLEYLPLNRIEAKHWRWHAEITQDGSLLVYRIGKGPMHALPDGLSRNPYQRDMLILCRADDWSAWRAVIRGIEQENASGRYDGDDPEMYTKDDVDKELEASGPQTFESHWKTKGEACPTTGEQLEPEWEPCPSPSKTIAKAMMGYVT